MGRKEEARKDNARLRKMDFQIRFLYIKIYNSEAVRFGKIKNWMGESERLSSGKLY